MPILLQKDPGWVSPLLYSLFGVLIYFVILVQKKVKAKSPILLKFFLVLMLYKTTVILEVDNGSSIGFVVFMVCCCVLQFSLNRILQFFVSF